MPYTRILVSAPFIVAVMMLSQAQAPARQRDAQRFVGTWRLVSLTQNGHPDPNRGPSPTGLIYYDRTGHMAAQIMPDRVRPSFDRNAPTPDEAHKAILGYTAYFGTYRVDERARTVTHFREGNLNAGELGDFIRRYEFEGNDRVILRPMETENRLVWERIK